MADPQRTPAMPRVVFISTADGLANMLATLADLPTSPPSLYIDLEGKSLSRVGTVSLLTLYVCPQDIVYLIDVHGLQASAFSTPASAPSQTPTPSDLDTVTPQPKPSDLDSIAPQYTLSGLGTQASRPAPSDLDTVATPVTLKTILESPTIPKVFFDVRNDSDALFAHYKIALSCIHDLQVMELATRTVTTGNSRDFLCSLSTCIRDNAALSPVDLDAWKAIKEAGNALFNPHKGGSYAVFETRPLEKDVQEYCVQDVVYMPLLWSVFEKRIQKDRLYEAEMAEQEEKDKKEGFWEVMVKEAVVHRISLLEAQLFASLKPQIIALATPLYGSSSTSSNTFYDIISYITSYPETTTTSSTLQPTYGVALLLYTGPPTAPYTSFHVISHVSHVPDIVTGARRLLADLQRGMGGVIGMCMETGDWTVTHERVPDVADPGVDGDGDGDKDEDEDEDDNEDEIEQKDGEYEREQYDKGDMEEEVGEDWCRMRWSPSLEPIAEET
ncbi:hypothetical protein PTNB85_08811 [Pyrenophora teres f. teres]|nr:hypothetical protein HRS9139_09437 [Pyrenophora teres f. teres]KAE8827458.1 hypothetical protein PTNB85_08811 [Pyrenophora teres f. teres]